MMNVLELLLEFVCNREKKKFSFKRQARNQTQRKDINVSGTAGMLFDSFKFTDRGQ